MMRRRALFKTAGAGLLAATFPMPAIAQSMPELKWRLTSAVPKTLATLYGGGERLAKNVAEATGGRFQIQCFAGGEIVPGLQAFDAVANGTVECGHTFTSYSIGKDPSFVFGTVLPFGLNPRQTYAWLVQGDGNALLNELFQRHNAYAIPAGNTGVQMGGWFRKEIKEVADLNGLKMRIPGLGGQILAKLGAVPQQLAGGDVYPSLERGTLDAAEWSSPIDDEKLGFVRVAKFYHFPGWWDCGTNMSLVVNLDKWRELPDVYKAVLHQASAEVNGWMQSKYDAENPAALRRLIVAGALLKPFPKEVMEKSFQAAQETYAEIAATNPTFKKLLDSYTAFRRDQYAWWQVAEYSFDTFMIQQRNRL
jgi:TRAP-type mannitol/chloroaromatic compound transport system substrate-binding protein